MMQPVRPASTAVKFYVPLWDDKATEANMATLRSMEQYIRSALAIGLDADEITEDLAGRFGHIGCIKVQHAGSTVWVHVDEDPLQDAA